MMVEPEKKQVAVEEEMQEMEDHQWMNLQLKEVEKLRQVVMGL